MMERPETALIIPIPAAEPLVGSLRFRYDRTASRGIPAHVTVLYPFVPPERITAALPEIAAALKSCRAFQVSFSHVGRFPRTAFLQPDDPEPFAALTRAVWSGWPDYPPYSGVHSQIVPHLTVADDSDSEVLNEIERLLAPRLPLHVSVDAVWAMASDERGDWRRIASIALQTERTPSF